MDKEQVQKALDELKKLPKRKFSQSYDLIINLKNIDLKTTPVDVFASLPNPRGMKIKIAAIVDQELAEQANKFCDLTIRENEFPKYSADKKLAKKLAQEYDYFIAQANLMPKIAAVFGRFLGTRGKMPNPKAGCVVPANGNLELLVKKLNQTIHFTTKKALNLQCLIGKEGQKDEEIVSNILAAYQSVAKQMPQDETQNIKNVCLKLTMSKPVKI
ncbi:MAG: 50S ribosomal protein L1 [Candidatus Woesearchaeota archaeon]